MGKKNELRQMLSGVDLESVSPVSEASFRRSGNTYWSHGGKFFVKGADGQKKEISQGEYEKARDITSAAQDKWVGAHRDQLKADYKKTGDTELLDRIRWAEPDYE